MKDYFCASNGEKISKEEVVEEIKNFIAQKPNSFYKVIIGTDSQPLFNNYADFVTAVVVHRIGNGGRYFWKRINGKKFFNLRDRIINEVMFSLGVSMELLDILKKSIETKFEFEVHVDVGENGKTSELISEVTGIIRGYNLNFKTKPESFAASNVADKHV